MKGRHTVVPWVLLFFFILLFPLPVDTVQRDDDDDVDQRQKCEDR